MKFEYRQRDRNQTDITAEIVAAYVANNPVPAPQLPNLIHDVFRSLTSLNAQISTEKYRTATPPTLAQIAASIKPDGLISFETGRKYKTLRRHLTSLGLSPAAYREKWSLPADYPMTCEVYSIFRSKLALQIGLGSKSSD